MSRHKWNVKNERLAYCNNCSRIRTKNYIGDHKLQRAYSDSEEDLLNNNFEYRASECKKKGGW